MGKQKQQAEGGPVEPEVPKHLCDVAKLLKKTLPEKSTSLLGHKVSYFIGRKAIDAIMESKLKDELQIGSRSQCCHLMDEMLHFKFFHRARKIAMEVKPRKKELAEGAVEEDTEATPKATPSQKSKKKFKLDMHHEQIFVDAIEPYVWLYDPIPLRTWLLGSLLVVAAIAVCMFPLWPRRMRDGVYYLSLAAAGFLGVILALAVIRQIVFVIIFMISFGKHRLWILPNLTEDCGFFESFVPLFSYEYCGEGVAGSQAAGGANNGQQEKSSKKKSSSSKSEAGPSSSSSSSAPKTSSVQQQDNNGSKTGSESEFEMLDDGEVVAKKDK